MPATKPPAKAPDQTASGLKSATAVSGLAGVEIEELFRLLMENMLDAVIIIDWEGTVLFTNKAGIELVGLKSLDEALGVNMANFIHPDSLEKVVEDLERVKRGQGGFLAEYKAVTVDGAIKWIETHNDKVNFKGRTADLIIIRDITERKKTEHALRESEERYRRFFEEDLSGTFITRPDGRILACNRAFARMFGFPSVEQVLASRAQRFYKDLRDRAKLLKRLLREKKLENYESILQRIDGTPIHIIENTVGIFNSQGRLMEIIGFFVDITRQKNLEAQLLHAQRMEAIGTLAGGVAHDFNNLLMTIQGNISLLLQDTEREHPGYQRLAIIEKAIKSGARLTRQLLAYARKGKYEVRRLDLNQLVKEAADTLGRTRKDIVIDFELSADLQAIAADRNQMELVLLNLLINAADAMPLGGKLVLETFNVTHDRIPAKLYDPKSGRYVLLTVTDTGIGMDADTCRQLFDPFFTTKKTGKAKGLGLASVYGIVKNHGGYIDVHSRPGKGTTFSVFLPAAGRPAPQAPSPVRAVEKGGIKILVVDDEEFVLDVAVKLLDRLGYKTVAARNGKEAVEIYQKNSDTIDLVILDMIMPIMDGGQAFDEIRKINPSARVLLSSGYSLEGRARDIMNRGCDGFIQKPFSLQELADRIKKLLAAADHS